MGKKKTGRPRIPNYRALQVLEWKREGKKESWIAEQLGFCCYRNEYGKLRCRSVSRYASRGREIEAELKRIGGEMRRLEATKGRSDSTK